MSPLVLAKAEALKLIPYRAFWIYVGVFSLLFFLCTQFATDLTSSFSVNDAPIDFSRYVSFPMVWKSFSWFAAWFFYLLSLLVALVVTNEFENRTMRQHVIDGVGRADIVIAKLLVVVGFSAFACFLVALFAFVFGKSGPAYSFVDGSSALLGLFVRGVGHLSFVVLIAFLMRRAVPTIIISLIFPILIEPIAGFAANKITGIQVGKYLPFEIFSNLTPSPVSVADFGIAVETASHSMLWGAGYIALFAVLALARAQSMDL